MTNIKIFTVLCLYLLLSTIGAAQPLLTINGTPSDYTTTKIYLDEIASESQSLTLLFTPGEANVQRVDIFSNLNRRDRADADANGDGIDDGIQPPDGNLIPSADDGHYFKAIPMIELGDGTWELVLPATRCGAYRMTARWQVQGDPDWRWLGDHGIRDHAIVVSPTEARDMCIYEFNVLTVEANQRDGDPNFIQRSTFEDLWDAPNASRTSDLREFHLDYLRHLGVNWSYIQPIHPPGIDGREINPDTTMPYQPGSPYAVKNFFEVNPWMAIAYKGGDEAQGRVDAMAAFQAYAQKADEAKMQIMLDAPFNHTGFDCELGPLGVQLFQPDGQTWNATDEIRNRDARF